MRKPARTSRQITIFILSVAAVALTVGLASASEARADEADAKRLLKAMSDYMAGQNTISFGYDSILEIVTQDEQKLALASSGAVTLNRPDRVRAIPVRK